MGYEIKQETAKAVAARRKLRDERRCRAKVMRDDGMEWSAIRKRLGVSISTMRSDRIAIERGEVD